MRVLTWPYKSERGREIKLYSGVSKIVDAGRFYILYYFDDTKVPDTIPKNDIFSMRVDE